MSENKEVVIRGNGNIVGNGNVAKRDGREVVGNVVSTKNKVLIDGDGNIVGNGNESK